MSSVIATRHSLRSKKTRKQTAKAAAYTATRIPPMTISSPATTLTSNIKKPMRPLTAYHIFFQIEREYIIQTMAGPDANKSIHDNKSYLHDVPRRYRSIKLLPDWSAGPGKRRKRKHRKSHGKIGFLELSRVISKRWATLESNDPETKRYVGMIAARELDVYKGEMKQYSELTKAAASSSVPMVPQPVLSSTASTAVGAMMISPSTSPSPTFVSSSSSHDDVPFMSFYMPAAESADLVLSLDQDFTAEEEDEIDYSICCVSKHGHYLPSPPGPELIDHQDQDSSCCDPIFELEDGYNKPFIKRCVSPVLSPDMNEGIIGGDNFFEL